MEKLFNNEARSKYPCSQAKERPDTLLCEFYHFLLKSPRIILSNMEGGYHRPDKKTLQALEDMANKLRIHSIESTNTAGSGYVASNRGKLSMHG